MTHDEILREAQKVRGANTTGENTAVRVGTVLTETLRLVDEKAATAEMSEKFASVAQQITALLSEVKTKAATAEMSEKFASVAQQITALLSEVKTKAAAAEMSEKFASVAQQIAALLSEVKTKAAAAEMSEKFASVAQQIAALLSEVKTKAAAADVKNQITSLNTHLQNLEEELDTLTTEVGTKAQDEEIQRKILELRSLLQTLQKDVNSKISSIRFDPNDDMVVVSIHTLLDSGVPFPAATQQKAGVMTAADKKELAKVQTITQQLEQMGGKLGLLYDLGTFDTQGAARQAAASNHVVYDLENVRFLTYTKQSASGAPNQGFILQTVNKERSMTHQLEFFMGHLSQRDISWNQNSGAVNAFKWEEIGALKFSTEEREEKTWLVVKNYENSLVARVALPDASSIPTLNFPDKPLDTLLREILDAHGAGFACNILCKAPRVEDFFDKWDFVFVGRAEVTEWRNYSYKSPQQQLLDVRNRMVRVDGVISFYRYKGQTESDPVELSVGVRWAASYEKIQVKHSSNYTRYSKLFPVVAPTRFEDE